MRQTPDRPSVTAACTDPGGPPAPALPPLRPLLDYAAASQLLGVSPRTTRTLIRTGRLQAVRIRRRVLIDATDVQRFIARAKASGTSLDGQAQQGVSNG